MKKYTIFSLILCILIITGCERPHSFLDNIPFIKKLTQDDGQAIKEPLKKEPETKTKEDKTDELTLEAAYFNDVTEANGRLIIQNPYNLMVLVNKEFGLPEDYLPNDLIRPNVQFSFGDVEIEKSLLRQDAAKALELMFKKAKEDGIELFAVSGYRSYGYQNTLFNSEVSRVGKEKAVWAVAFPGQSEHQTGLAMDISSRSEDFKLTNTFGDKEEGKWLAKNAHRFGYILRYPKGKEEITGYQYEAWHFRYIGVEHATIIYKNKLTLEEYFNIVKKI